MLKKQVLAIVSLVVAGCGGVGAPGESPGQTPGAVKSDVASASALDGLPSDPSELAKLYRAGRAPESVSALQGQVQGRFLGGPALAGPAARITDWLRREPSPWLGKTFLPPTDDGHGSGFNRLQNPFTGQVDQAAYFALTLGPSHISGESALLLDYDVDANAAPVRLLIAGLKDEIRQIGPTVWLGQTYLRVSIDPNDSSHDILLFYFGLQTQN